MTPFTVALHLLLGVALLLLAAIPALIMISAPPAASVFHVPDTERPSDRRTQSARLLQRAIKEILGANLLICGITMAGGPTLFPALVLISIGISLIDFPGKEKCLSPTFIKGLVFAGSKRIGNNLIARARERSASNELEEGSPGQKKRGLFGGRP